MLVRISQSQRMAITSILSTYMLENRDQPQEFIDATAGPDAEPTTVAGLLELFMMLSERRTRAANVFSQVELDAAVAAACRTPGCDHTIERPFELSCMRHHDSPLLVAYQAGQLMLRCAECRLPVGLVVVGDGL
jgi:hypothetical protein